MGGKAAQLGEACQLGGSIETPLPEVISRSSRNGGRPVLDRRDVRALKEILDRLDEHFQPRLGVDALDVEFLFTRRRRRPIILQARPFRSAQTPG